MTVTHRGGGGDEGRCQRGGGVVRYLGDTARLHGSTTNTCFRAYVFRSFRGPSWR